MIECPVPQGFGTVVHLQCTIKDGEQTVSFVSGTHNAGSAIVNFLDGYALEISPNAASLAISNTRFSFTLRKRRK